ncbi:response regulator [Pricia sp.]|uniref:response regulator n=1 Tax=Pricia sp. TaxID=2268138 RepID=UPI00359446C5
MEKLTLYLADDDADDREFFIEALEEVPVLTEVREFSNGVDLMDALFSKEPLPDAVFLDLHMPLMDGFECLTDIRSFPQFAKVKIIVYSTSYHEREVNQLKEDGADHYLQKPNSFQELQSLLFQSVRILEHEQSDTNITGQFILLAQPS